MRDNGSYGLTTLRNRHAKFTATALRLVFKGKHGVAADIVVTDPRLRRVVRKCQDLPGQLLLQYVDDTDGVHPILSSDVNDYLRDVADVPVTAKDFRTWAGTLLAVEQLASRPEPETAAAANRGLVEALDNVSAHLRNTRAVCRASYVHPAILEWYADGSLPQRWQVASSRGSAALVPEERRLRSLLGTLRPATRRDRRARAA